MLGTWVRLPSLPPIKKGLTMYNVLQFCFHNQCVTMICNSTQRDGLKETIQRRWNKFHNTDLTQEIQDAIDSKGFDASIVSIDSVKLDW